jgi:hypothetical protein
MRRPVITVLADNRSCKLGPFPDLLLPFADGFRTEHIVAELGSELRRRAATDRLLRATGVADYVVTVLVPQLAVMLIKEDMRAGDEEARRILQESTRLGQTLHEDA